MKYYYRFDGLEFCGIFKDDLETVDHMNFTAGPFDTFQEAKNDALERCKTDLKTTKLNMHQIRAIKKKEV